MTAASAKYALFDLDDTLVDTATAFHAFCREFVLAYDLAQGDTDVAAETERLLSSRVASSSWREFCDHAEEWYGITTPRDELYSWIVAAYPPNFTLDPRVAKGLVRLRADGWKLAIVTNGSTEVQQAKIDNVDLRAYVDFVIDSESAGSRKPHRRIFEIAADGLGVRLGRDGWMVGDNHANDIVGAHAAGLRTIWLPYANEQPADAIEPDHTVASVLDAIEIIAAG